MCSKDLKDLAGLALLGQLGYRHWGCYGCRKGHVGVEQQFDGLQSLDESELLGLQRLSVQTNKQTKTVETVLGGFQLKSMGINPVSSGSQFHIMYRTDDENGTDVHF